MVSDTEIRVSNAADERADMANESVARMKRNVITCTMYLNRFLQFDIYKARTQTHCKIQRKTEKSWKDLRRLKKLGLNFTFSDKNGKNMHERTFQRGEVYVRPWPQFDVEQERKVLRLATAAMGGCSGVLHEPVRTRVVDVCLHVDGQQHPSCELHRVQRMTKCLSTQKQVRTKWKHANSHKRVHNHLCESIK